MKNNNLPRYVRVDAGGKQPGGDGSNPSGDGKNGGSGKPDGNKPGGNGQGDATVTLKE